jgi:alpha-tubulin suppressor-like RCC1 family protein
LFTWGLNNYGQLGLGDRDNRDEPQLVVDDVFLGKKLKQLDGGEHHSLALSENGDVYSFGRGNYGQLGHASEENCLIPKLVDTLSGRHVVKIACGDHHSLALTDSNELYTWGYGEMLQLGNGKEADETVPYHVESSSFGHSKLLEIHGGAQHTVLLSSI